MAGVLVTIPKKEYELLVKCRRVVESEFEERFSERFIRDVRESEDAYRRGDYLRFNNVKEARKHFDRA